jgi:hypothetical protein
MGFLANSDPYQRTPTQGNRMPDYKEPTSKEDADARVDELKRVRMLIQNELAARRPLSTHGSLNEEYRRWRKSAVLKQAHVDGEISYLKRWVKEYHVSFNKALLHGTDYQTVRASCRSEMENMFRFCDGMLNEIRQLQEENHSLRQRILKLENTLPVAPSGGVDEWRDE